MVRYPSFRLATRTAGARKERSCPTCPASPASSSCTTRPGISSARYAAAMDGRLHLARSLLGLGADPGIRDQRFDSTPLGWARYFGQEQLVALLEPLTAAEEP